MFEKTKLTFNNHWRTSNWFKFGIIWLLLVFITGLSLGFALGGDALTLGNATMNIENQPLEKDTLFVISANLTEKNYGVFFASTVNVDIYLLLEEFNSSITIEDFENGVITTNYSKSDNQYSELLINKQGPMTLYVITSDDDDIRFSFQLRVYSDDDIDKITWNSVGRLLRNISLVPIGFYIVVQILKLFSNREKLIGMLTKCPECGTENQNVKFCTKCGHQMI